jgi:predicted double-glycine peptidase
LILQILIIVALIGCTSISPELKQLIAEEEGKLDRSHLIESVTFYPQNRYQCGPAALAILLSHNGIRITPEELIDSVYVPDLRGSLEIEMLAATRKRGQLAYELETTFKSLIKEVDSGRPVLILQNLGLEIWPKWHYTVVIGYDLDGRSVTLHSGVNDNYTMSLAAFEQTWGKAGNWAMIAVQPCKTTSTMNGDSYFASAVAFERVNSPSASEKVYIAGTYRWPNNRLINIAYANFLHEQDRFEESIRLYKHILQVYPTDAITHNNLAQALYEYGDLDLAEHHALIATEIGGRYSERYLETLEKIRNKKAIFRRK